MEYATQFLGQRVIVTIDRQLGSRHPKHGYMYPVNYGYIKGVIAPDGDELDAYVLGIYEPIQEFAGTCIAVVHRTNDEDDKIIVVPEGKAYTNDQIRALTEFQEQYFTSEILRK